MCRRHLALEGWLAVAVVLALPACTPRPPRASCNTDADCSNGFCQADGKCLPADVVSRLGGVVGDECQGSGAGVCPADVPCRMGRCSSGEDEDEDEDVDAPQGPGSEPQALDDVAPTFAGIESAVLGADGVSAELCWTAGDDGGGSSAATLVYDVYQTQPPEAYAFDGLPQTTSAAGATCTSVSGLLPNSQYCWAVLARDVAGNQSGATGEELCLATPAVSCIDYATMVQPVFNARCIACHSGATPPQKLHLDSYAGVMTGGNTGNEITRCRPDLSLLYDKISHATPSVGARMPFGGPYLDEGTIELLATWMREGARQSCDEVDPCSDTSPPTFSGITTASQPQPENPTTARLCWDAADDGATPKEGLVYDVYQAMTAGRQDFSAPPRTSSAAGDSCVDVGALSPEQAYCFVVRARDGAGNQDINEVERCVTMGALSGGCVDYTTMVQPLLDVNCVRCHSGSMPPQWLRLDSYAGVIGGSVRRKEVQACDAAGSMLIDKVEPNPSLGKRMPFDGPPYLTTQQTALLQQWVTQGARRDCQEASSCSDSTPPSFTGLGSAVATDATTLRLCWPAASDAVTGDGALRYNLFEATSAGGQVFAQPAQSTVVGQTCTDVRTGPGTSLCFVVRAQDLAGNQDGNTVEHCAQTPVESCAVEYDSLVQPLLRARCTHCHSGTSAPRFLDLATYGGILAGGVIGNDVVACDWESSHLRDKIAGTSDGRCGSRMPFDGPPYLAPSEVALLGAWVESGARRRCSDASPCGDRVAPQFAGLTSATELDPATARLCFEPASDDTSDSATISYDVYEATSAGSQSFNARPAYVAPPGSTCFDVPMAPGGSACWVARARDLAGNRDTNTVQRCLTTSNACFDFGQSLQPLLSSRCVHCHGPTRSEKDIRWDSYAHAMSSDEVEACRSDSGKMLEVIDDCEMPNDTGVNAPAACRACLSPMQRLRVRTWIDQGAHPACPNGGCR